MEDQIRLQKLNDETQIVDVQKKIKIQSFLGVFIRFIGYSVRMLC